jgi:hypothetical protein
MSRTKEDLDYGFKKNTLIIDMKTVKSSLPLYYLEGAYPVRIKSSKDSKYCNDSFDLFVRKKEGIGVTESSKEHTESILTIPTIPTNHVVCPKCNYHDVAFHMRVHMERCQG